MKTKRLEFLISSKGLLRLLVWGREPWGQNELGRGVGGKGVNYTPASNAARFCVAVCWTEP